MSKLSRRTCLGLGGGALFSAALPALAKTRFRLGLTPVFLDNDGAVIDRLRDALSTALGVPVEMAQRRTYKEVTQMLLDDALDAAWLCGYPYLQHKNALSLVAVPLWNDKPLYRSYLIVDANDTAASLDDLRGDIHAFSDPDSNSGFLVTASDLARRGQRVDEFFERTIYTFGHRNVVRAVSVGLVRSGSVDGYVWEALARVEPEMTARTKVIGRSEWLGFPPVCARTDRLRDPIVRAFQQAMLNFERVPGGSDALDLLQLDGMTLATPALFDGIAQRMRDYEQFR